MWNFHEEEPKAVAGLGTDRWHQYLQARTTAFSDYPFPTSLPDFPHRRAGLSTT